jgi:prolyl oligopeptidase PreP (S9A serine peptidase family)
MRSVTLLACCATFLSLPTRASAQTAKADSADPYLWLEDVNGARAMAWVKAENAKTAAVLEKDSRWDGIYKASLAMAQAKDRLTYVNSIGGELYNFWEDSAHVRGIWRKTSLESFRTASPKWTTVLDLDALAKAEKANWVFHGYTCQQPAEKRCLIDLSDGGEDASTIREFDLATRSFVKDGFYLPKGKQRVAWTSQDTILVAREWNPGEVTSSGYAFIVKKLARGNNSRTLSKSSVARRTTAAMAYRPRRWSTAPGIGSASSSAPPARSRPSIISLGRRTSLGSPYRPRVTCPS